MLLRFEIGFIIAALLCTYLSCSHKRNHLKQVGIYAAITLSVIFILGFVFIILPFSAMELTNEGFWHFVRDYSIAFRKTVIRPLLPIIITAVLTANITLAVVRKKEGQGSEKT